MARVPNIAIKEIRLPETALPMQRRITFVGRVRFPRMQNPIQIPARQWRQQNVNVIRHHHPRLQPVSLAIEMQQVLLHNPGHLILSQITTATALIQICIHSFPSLFVEIFLRQMCQFSFPSFQHLRWHRIKQAIANRLRCFRAIKMRQIAPRIPAITRL